MACFCCRCYGCLRSICFFCLPASTAIVLTILAAALLMLMHPQQYYDYVAPIVSPKRISQRIRDVDSVQSHQVLGLLRNAYSSDFPLVIRGGVNHWYAAGRWTPAHVREEVGRNSWILLQSGVQEQEASPFINTTMGAFTDWLEKQEEEKKSGKQRATTDPTYYLAEEFAFVEQHEGLVSELGLHDLDEFWESSNKKGRRSSNSYNKRKKKNGVCQKLLILCWVVSEACFLVEHIAAMVLLLWVRVMVLRVPSGWVELVPELDGTLIMIIRWTSCVICTGRKLFGLLVQINRITCTLRTSTIQVLSWAAWTFGRLISKLILTTAVSHTKKLRSILVTCCSFRWDIGMQQRARRTRQVCHSDQWRSSIGC